MGRERVNLPSSISPEWAAVIAVSYHSFIEIRRGAEIRISNKIGLARLKFQKWGSKGQKHWKQINDRRGVARGGLPLNWRGKTISDRLTVNSILELYGLAYERKPMLFLFGWRCEAWTQTSKITPNRWNESWNYNKNYCLPITCKLAGLPKIRVQGILLAWSLSKDPQENRLSSYHFILA